MKTGRLIGSKNFICTREKLIFKFNILYIHLHIIQSTVSHLNFTLRHDFMFPLKYFTK